MKFTNKAIEKERKKLKNLMYVWILLFVLSGVFFYLGIREDENEEKQIKTLHEIIVDKNETKDNIRSYVNINSIPYKFAIYDGIDEAYYFVTDENFMYVAYMDEEDFNLLNDENIKSNPKKIEGTTKYVTKDIKKLAIETYNEAMENEEDKLSIADYDNYFGSVYLDMTMTGSSTAGFYYVMFFISLIIGVILIIIERIYTHRFKKGIKKLTDSEIMNLDSEMNSPDAFYYSKARLYLTKNYIINFGGTFRTIKYDDIIWMYPFEYRTNGIKTSQSIIVVTKDGKKHNIASLDVITKAKKEMYNEIFNTIASKNKNIIIGFDKESKEKAKEELKKFKLK